MGLVGLAVVVAAHHLAQLNLAQQTLVVVAVAQTAHQRQPEETVDLEL